jgi:hypothetical protein
MIFRHFANVVCLVRDWVGWMRVVKSDFKVEFRVE